MTLTVSSVQLTMQTRKPKAGDNKGWLCRCEPQAKTSGWYLVSDD